MDGYKAKFFLPAGPWRKKGAIQPHFYIEIISMNPEQFELARSAWRIYGKGQHPAGLNLGDCCSYALSRYSGEPLLFKGNDFSKTDIRSVAY